MSINPFNITKAVDYTDEQINNLWVDLPGAGFKEILKPTSPMPMLIIGGKGSGKTHIMRYFSYSLQTLRFQNVSPIQGIIRDGYIGIYMRCTGLNADRFSGRGQSMDAWKTVYSFYMELWLSQLLLNNFNRINIFSNQPDKDLEKNIVKKILTQFDKLENTDSIFTIKSLIEYLRELQRKVDYEINNCALTGKSILEIDISVSPGKLIFGIPQILVRFIKEIRKVNFLSLLSD